MGAGTSAGESQPKVSPFEEGSPLREGAPEGRSLDDVMGELASIASRQSVLVAHARALVALDAESSRARHEEEISSLTAQLASVKATLASSKAEQLSSKAKLEQAEALMEKMAAEKTAAVLELEKERSAIREREAHAKSAMEALELAKAQHFANVDAFGRRFEEKISNAEERLRKLSIEYDEELYPHLVQSVAERRYNKHLCYYFFCFCLRAD